MRIPAILPLILLGLIVGPISTIWNDGEKWIEPIYDAETGTGIFPESYFFYFVSLAIGIILFEGGLTLKRKEIRGLGPVILTLVTLGSLVTFLGAGTAAYLLLDIEVGVAFLFGALIIVTGPTVIAPILQNVALKRNLATILKWESIIIDPIGAFVSVLVFEFVLSNRGALAFTPHALITFVQILLIGLAIGTLAGFLLYFILKKDFVPHYLINVVTLALVLGVFVFSDIVATESGLLSVVAMGTVLGNLDIPKLRDILDFKESLSILLISILFIILAAHINISDLMLLRDWRILILLLVVIFVLRPLAVWLSTLGSDLSFKEKAYISLIGPRGIVAAGIASLFGLRLVVDGIPGAEYITPLVFMVVLGTVLLSATAAQPMADFLKVSSRNKQSILIIGANAAVRLISTYLEKKGTKVILIDNNVTNIEKAQSKGLEAYAANVFHDDVEDLIPLKGMTHLLSLTGSPDVNRHVCKKYQRQFKKGGTFRIRTGDDVDNRATYFPTFDDYINFIETARDYPIIYELHPASLDELLEMLSAMRKAPNSIALFVLGKNEQFKLIPSDLSQCNYEEGDVLVYFGKRLKELEPDSQSQSIEASAE